MSGGRYNYQDSALRTAIFGWTDRPGNVFEDREISELVWDVLDLIHDYDWYASGYTCKETYLKKKAEFKKKWLSNRGVRVRKMIDTAIDEIRKELYETYGMELEVNVVEYIDREALLDSMEKAELALDVSALTDRGDWLAAGIESMVLCVLDAPKADVATVLPCPEDCIYRGKRHQKCSCCARNKYLKDCYVGSGNDG